MAFISDINEAINSGIEQFKVRLLQELEHDVNYLERPFWRDGGSQLTVLNVLIQQHQENPENDLTDYITFVLERTRDLDRGEPVHQALVSGKIQLAFFLLQNHVFDVNRRDKAGRTLLSLVLAMQDARLLELLLRHKVNIHETTFFSSQKIPYQPIHQAVIVDFARGVTLLAQAGASLDNPGGVWMETPLLLAARLGSMNALAVLLEYPAEKLALAAENNDIEEDKNGDYGDNAMESLCRRLFKKRKDKSLVHGIAMLLCCGAEPPRREEMRHLLVGFRAELLDAIDGYLEKRPELVNAFVMRCHESANPLHALMYGDYSWGKALRQLLGRPDPAAFAIERWVTRKCKVSSAGQTDKVVLPVAATVLLSGDEFSLQLYAEFVRRYEEIYQNQIINNPWSTMRWMIAQGQSNWQAVLEYSRSHPGSRTRNIVDAMFDKIPASAVSLNQQPVLPLLSS